MKETVVSTIFFADLMNSTEMAKNLTLLEYDEMIVAFQDAMYEVTSHHLPHYGYLGQGADCEWSIIGDELRVFFYSGSVLFDIRSALLIGMKIKLSWLTSAFNQRIMKEGRIVSRIGVGMNTGKVIKDVRNWRVKMGREQANVEGYAINLTKRIEAASREGSNYQIVVGDSLYRACQKDTGIKAAFGPPLSLDFKGLSQKIPVYELVSFINYEIIESMPEAFKKGLLEKMEYAVTRPMPEPWIFVTLLRYYLGLIASGRHEPFENRAVDLAHQALEVAVYKPPILNMLGWIHAYGKVAGNPDKALQLFEHALSLEPTNRSSLLHRARILEKKGHKDLSQEAYKEILYHDKGHDEARRKLGLAL